MKTIDIRRSIRSFTDKKVEAETIEQLLRAAMQAPSAYNQRAWEFLVVEDKEILAELSKMSDYAGPVNKSAVTIVVMANESNLSVPECWQQDLGAATQNILLEAVEHGLGAVWMAAAPTEDRITYIKELFELPEEIKPYSVIALGYSDAENKYIDRFEPNKIHYGKW